MSIGIGRPDEHAPGYSVKDTGDRMKGGAVIDERSPDTEVRLKTCIENGVQAVIRVSLTT